MFQCSLTGTLFVYQGQEMGLCNVPRNWGEEEYKDIETIQNLEGEREYRRKTTGEKDPDMSDVLKDIRQTARDNGRTPIQVSLAHRTFVDSSGTRVRMPDSQRVPHG